jgi:hypothetical protein
VALTAVNGSFKPDSSSISYLAFLLEEQKYCQNEDLIQVNVVIDY